jgi:hypothetical protein
MSGHSAKGLDVSSNGNGNGHGRDTLPAPAGGEDIVEDSDGRVYVSEDARTETKVLAHLANRVLDLHDMLRTLNSKLDDIADGLGTERRERKQLAERVTELEAAAS